MNLEKKKINDVKHDTGLPGKPRKCLFFETIHNAGGKKGLSHS